MNQIIEKENIDNLIYEVRGWQVMLDSEIDVTKCHDFIYDDIVIFTNIV